MTPPAPGSHWFINGVRFGVVRATTGEKYQVVFTVTADGRHWSWELKFWDRIATPAEDIDFGFDPNEISGWDLQATRTRSA